MLIKSKALRCLLPLLLIIVLAPSAWADSVEITILHTNDTHSRVEEGSYAGMGFAKIATLVKDMKAGNANVLLLDAGDAFHGQIIANLVQGESIAQIMKAVGYDAMVPGNHDFNYGKDRLLELAEMTDFPIIAANVKKSNESYFLEPYVIKECGGIKVGIFGLTTPETTYKTHPKNVAGLTFIDPVQAAKSAVAELEGRADVIVALAHLGLSQGSQYTSEEVAEQVPGIDLIVDGHSHDALASGKTVGDTLIVMAGEYTKNLGVVTLTVEDGKVVSKEARLITKEDAANTPEDPEIIQLVKEINARNAEITSVVIGKTAVDLDGERSHVRTQEANLGNLITDAMLAAVDADVAITNGGGIRASISKGDVTKGDVITVLPFGNFVVVKEMTGAQILEALEHGVSSYPAAEGLFPQVGGLSFVFIPSRPAGERVLKVEVGGRPLDLKKTYRVATNDFLAAGGDGYKVFQQCPTVQEAGGLEEVVMNYIRNQGTVAPKLEGRITTVEETAEFLRYRIRPGDTLSEVAKYFGVDLEDLVELNELKDANVIKAGAEILIPKQ